MVPRVYVSAALMPILLASQVAAQSAPKPVPPFTVAPAQDSLVALPALPVVYAGSTLGWLLGVAGGVAVGEAIHSAKDSEGDTRVDSPGLLYGVWIGGSVGAAAGAHLANRRHGSIVQSTAGSILISPAALFIASVGAFAAADGSDNAGFLVLAIPVVQIGLSVVIERVTSKRRAKQ